MHCGIEELYYTDFIQLSTRSWDTESRELIRVLHGHTDSVTCVSIAGDGCTLVSGAKDRTARVWDLLTCTSVPVNFEHPVRAIAACPTSPVAVVGLENGTIHVLDLVSRATRDLGQHHDRVRAIEFAPGGG